MLTLTMLSLLYPSYLYKAVFIFIIYNILTIRYFYDDLQFFTCSSRSINYMDLVCSYNFVDSDHLVKKIAAANNVKLIKQLIREWYYKYERERQVQKPYKSSHMLLKVDMRSNKTHDWTSNNYHHCQKCMYIHLHAIS